MVIIAGDTDRHDRPDRRVDRRPDRQDRQQDRTGSTGGSTSAIDGSEIEKRYTASLSRIIAICDRAGSTQDRAGSDRIGVQIAPIDHTDRPDRLRLISIV